MSNFTRYTIFGDGVRDNTQELQTLVNYVANLPSSSGVGVKLIGHTRINWDFFAWPKLFGGGVNTFKLEIEGKLECIGGIMEIPDLVQIAGVAGGDGAFSGGFSYGNSTINRTGVNVANRTFTNLSVGDKTQFGLLFGIPGDITNVAQSSDGQTLPQSTINVVSTAAFPSVGTIYVNGSSGLQTITYTGITATSFTGCSGGSGTLVAGGTVSALTVGQTITVSNSSHSINNGTWTIISWYFQPLPPPLNYVIRAIKLGAIGFSNGVNETIGLVSGSFTGTTIASGSNGQSLPQATINVASTSGFPVSGLILVATGAGNRPVSYSGKTPTSFTGCSGGTGVMSTGGAVVIQGAISAVYDCFHFSNAANLDTSAWKGYLYMEGSSQPLQIDDWSRIVGITTSTDGYAINYNITRDAILPDGYNGSIQGSLQLPTIRILNAGSCVLTDISVPTSPGIAIVVDTGNGVTMNRCHLSDFGARASASTFIDPSSNGAVLPQSTINVSSTAGYPTSGTILVQSRDATQFPVTSQITYTGKTGTSFTGCSGGTGTLFSFGQVDNRFAPFENGSLPLLIDGAFELDFDQCNFQVNSTMSGPRTAVLMTISQFVAFTGFIEFRRCRNSGAGYLINAMTTESTSEMTKIIVRDNVLENQAFPLLIVDPRNVAINEIKLEEISIADPQPGFQYGCNIYSPVPTTPKQVRALRVEGGTLGENGLGIVMLHANVALASLQHNATIDTNDLAASNLYNMGNLRYFSHQSDYHADFPLSSANAGLGPQISPDVIWLDLWDDPFDGYSPPWNTLPTSLGGTFTITPVRAPNGLVEAAQLHCTTSDSIQIQKTSLLPNGAIASVGDYFIIGVWVRAMSPIDPASSFVFLFQMPSSGQIVKFDYTSASIDMQDQYIGRDGGGWRLLTKIAKITSIPLGPATVFTFALGVDGGHDKAYWKPFGMYIPASKGYTEDEIIRYYRHVRDFVHGAPAGTTSIPKNVKLGFGNDTNLYRSLGRLTTDNPLNSRLEVDVNGVRSLWRRQPAIANVDGTLTDLTNKFNVLLDTLRTHGIIDGMATPIQLGPSGGASPDAFWYESNVIGSFSVNRVSSWTDQTSGAHNAIQSINGFRPFFNLADPIFAARSSLQFQTAFLDGGVFDTFAGNQATIAIVINIPTTFAIKGGQAIICKQDLTTNNAWYIGTDITNPGSLSANKITFFVNSFVVAVSDTVPINDGITHLIVATYDNVNVKLYKDGVLLGTHAQTGNINNPGNHLGIGAFIDAGGSAANAIKQMSMSMAIGWKRVLTASELAFLQTYTQVTYGTV